MPEMTLPELIRKWYELRDARLECETAAKAVGKSEDAAADAILRWLAASGQRSAGVPGFGTVARKVNIRVQSTDHERMAEFLYQRLQAAKVAGQPLVDHLVLQKAAAQAEMLEWARGKLPADADPGDPEVLNAVLGPAGFTARAVESLHFSRERRN
jgi:hypothetical protein